MQRVHHISFHYLAQDSILKEMNHTFNGIFNVLKLFLGLCTSHGCSHLVWIQLQCFSAGSLSLLLHNYSAMDQQLILRLELNPNILSLLILQHNYQHLVIHIMKSLLCSFLHHIGHFIRLFELGTGPRVSSLSSGLRARARVRTLHRAR
jgi:hypothetical protein